MRGNTRIATFLYDSCHSWQLKYPRGVADQVWEVVNFPWKREWPSLKQTVVLLLLKKPTLNPGDLINYWPVLKYFILQQGDLYTCWLVNFNNVRMKWIACILVMELKQSWLPWWLTPAGGQKEWDSTDCPGSLNSFCCHDCDILQDHLSRLALGGTVVVVLIPLGDCCSAAWSLVCGVSKIPSCSLYSLTSTWNHWMGLSRDLLWIVTNMICHSALPYASGQFQGSCRNSESVVGNEQKVWPRILTLILNGLAILMMEFRHMCMFNLRGRGM